jgi:hypothetical protein
MGNHGAQTTPTYAAISLAARFYRVDDDLTTSHTENRLVSTNSTGIGHGALAEKTSSDVLPRIT